MKKLVALAPLLCSCGGLVDWVDPSGSTGTGGAGSTTSSIVASTGNSMLDCAGVDAFDCESKPGCISACLSTPDEGCFATCRPLTSVACVTTCTEQSPACPPGFTPEGDGECYTGYCVAKKVCLD